MTYEAKARAFADLHVPGTPLVLYNIWDAGTAGAVTAAGAKALATGSWSVAEAHGYGDGEQIPLDLLLTVCERISTTQDLPLTVDFEGGFAAEPDQITAHVQRVVGIGAVGVNFEDQIIGETGLYGVARQAERVAAVRAAHQDLFVNARTDLFLKEKDPLKHADLLPEALERAAAYGEAGASGFFAPGLRDPDLIAQLCEKLALPVNVMMRGLTLDIVREAGVARASYGPLPYVDAMKAIAERFTNLA
ncbi:isocitrate lyase/PEP mutase family protein [Epibacterium ulvae]|uniref:isocitrate lyase/PEP mutase family protein n=1 Tax=Epibacterium ulvae TaxID=1156985 RepID=UPI002491CEEB|nr:isocitrate lyase/phosphoenolpyruvate mutase family protein [Epibacterium ulvae]